MVVLLEVVVVVTSPPPLPHQLPSNQFSKDCEVMLLSQYLKHDKVM